MTTATQHPSTFVSPKNRILTIRVSPIEVEALAKLVARDGENASVLVRGLIRKAAADQSSQAK